MPSLVPEERILVVDDDETILFSVSMVLRREGYCVKTHDSGFGLAMAMRQHRPDLVLLDVDMPGLRGDAALRAAAELGGVDAPVVLVSGIEPVELEKRATLAGAASFLHKPVTSEGLLSCVRACLAGERKLASG